MPSPHDSLTRIDRRTSLGISTVALVTAIAPFAVQTGVLLWSGSVALTLILGLLLAALFCAGAIALQAKLAGGLRAVPMISRIGAVAAVIAYHAIAFPVALALDATLFATGR